MMCFACAENIVLRAIDERGIKKLVADLVSDYDKTLAKAWVKKSNKAIADSIKAFLGSPDNTTGYQSMVSVLGKELATVVKPQDIKRLTVLTDKLYKTLKKAEINVLDAKYKITNLDRGAIKALSREGPFWTGKFYDTHLSAKIRDVGYKTAVESGLGRVDAGKAMEKVLKRNFALQGGTLVESVVPATYAGNVGNYTRLIAANVAQRSRVYSSVSAMADAEFKRYQFSAVMDERTSEVCQEMNGRVFSVKNAVATVEQAANAESPEAFKEAHPWPKNAQSIRDIAGTGTPAQQSANLENSNIALPPLHGFCRSAIEAVD